MQTQRPFLPEDRSRAAAPNHLVRAAFVLAKARSEMQDPAQLAAQLYRGDEATLAVVTKADATVGTTTGSGWVNHLVQTALANFLFAIGPLSAAATLMQTGTRLNVSEHGQVNVPIRSTLPVTPAWVTETNPIPIKQDTFATVALGPARKLGAIIVLSREAMRRSDAANIFSTLLREDASKGLDAAVFNESAAVSDLSPAGLLYGATELSGGSDLLSDMQSLARSVAVGGSGQVVFVGGLGMAAAAGLDARISARILGSPAVAETRLIALDPASLIWGNSDFEVTTSDDGVLHMSTDPLEIVDASAVKADPVRSLYQTDAISTRLLFDIAFAKRRASAVAFMDDVSYWT